jgi:lipopolysaccharide export system ATP-binding protein
MNAGEIMVQGTPDEIVSSPEARRLYLGESFTM